MAGLVGYDSSDEEEEVQQGTSAQRPQSPERTHAPESKDEPTTEPVDGARPPSPPNQAQHPAPEPQLGPSLPPDTAIMGPSLPPPGAASSYPIDMDQDLEVLPEDTAPSSPYSANRALLRNLTLPTVPNLNIPPSPPGSPGGGGPSALDAKFETFLDLKRNKGVHFNTKIAQSSALRNPAVMDKLLGFVGLDTAFDPANGDGTAQYVTTLSGDLWDPAAFPEWAYRGPLRRSQERVQKERARSTGEAVQFVSAAAAGSEGGGSRQAGRSGTPSKSVPAVTGKRKSRFDQL